MKSARLAPVALALLLSACGGTTTAPQASTSSPGTSNPVATASAGPAPAQKDKLVASYSAVTPNQLVQAVAKERGFFDQNGLDVEVTSIPTGSNPVSALIGGQIQSHNGSGEVVQAGVAGADVEYIMAPTTVLEFFLDTIPSIKTADQLKGKQIAVTALGSITHSSARAAVKSLNLDPDKDVVFTPVNNPPAILSAMQNGAVQAGSIGLVNIIPARKAGMHEMVDVAKLPVSYPNAWVTVSRKWANDHPDVTSRYVKSLLQAIAFEKTHAEETEAILGKYAKTDDQDFLKQTYELSIPHMQKVPLADLKGVQTFLDEIAPSNPQAKGVDPAKFVDNHWVQQFQDDGFIDSLYK